MKLWSVRFVFGAVLAVVVVAHAGAMDDADLRRGLRDAGLVPYWTFKPSVDFRYQNVATQRPSSLSDFKGQVVLVNVWATWCPPCVHEMPSLQRLHDAYSQRGLVVLGVNIRDTKSPTAVAEWLTERKLTFVNVKAQDDGPNLPSGLQIPQTFLIDRSGRLLANKPGAHDWAGPAVKAVIERLLDGL